MQSIYVVLCNILRSDLKLSCLLVNKRLASCIAMMMPQNDVWDTALVARQYLLIHSQCFDTDLHAIFVKILLNSPAKNQGVHLFEQVLLIQQDTVQ